MQVLKRGHTELFRRGPDECFASIPALARHCLEQKEKSTDRWVPPGNLKTRPLNTDTLMMDVGENGAFRMNDWSFTQLCQLAKVSKDTVNRLSADTAWRVFHETMPQGNKPLQILTQGESIRSIHGVSYTRLFNSDLVAMIQEFAVDFQPPQKAAFGGDTENGGEGGTGLYAGEQDMFAFLIDPTGWAEIDGQAFAPGFFIWNSEVGKRSLGIETFWFQAVCQNHIVWDATEVIEFTRKHTASVTYNSKAKVTQVNNNAGGIWTFTYAANGIDLTGVSDSIGTLLTLGYGNSSLPHLPTSITGADGNTWTRTYNAYGQILTEVPPTGSPTGPTTYTYEETSGSPNRGMLKTITNGAGNVTQFTGYTSLGDVTSIVQTPEPGTDITTSYTYDGGQRVTSETLPDGKQTTYAYNYRKLASVTDEAGNTTAFTFCSICGKLNGLLAPLAKNLSWQEDGDHRTTGFTDARSNQTQYEYGLAGELKKTLYPDGSYSIYRYDNYGRLAETEDTRGNKQQYAYDAAGRVDSLTLVPYSGTSSTIDYNYRVDDLISSVTDEVGTTIYSYTSGRKIAGVSYDWSASGLTSAQSVLYSYNPDGTRDSMEWEDGATSVVSWDYGYDGAGRTTSVVNSFGDMTSYTYDGLGHLKTQSNQNGTILTYTYNHSRGWPIQILWKLGSTPFAQYDLTYDDGANTIGNLTDVTELDGSTVPALRHSSPGERRESRLAGRRRIRQAFAP